MNAATATVLAEDGTQVWAARTLPTKAAQVRAGVAYGEVPVGFEVLQPAQALEPSRTGVELILSIA